MHRHDGFGPRRDRLLDPVHVHEVVGGDVHQDRGCAHMMYGGRGRHHGVRDRDDLVSRADARCQQGELQTVGAVSNAGAVGRPDELRVVRLEVAELAAEHHVTRRQHPVDAIE